MFGCSSHAYKTMNISAGSEKNTLHRLEPVWGNNTSRNHQSNAFNQKELGFRPNSNQTVVFRTRHTRSLSGYAGVGVFQSALTNATNETSSQIPVAVCPSAGSLCREYGIHGSSASLRPFCPPGTKWWWHHPTVSLEGSSTSGPQRTQRFLDGTTKKLMKKLSLHSYRKMFASNIKSVRGGMLD